MEADREKAASWYHRAAEGYQTQAVEGNAHAQQRLGLCLFRGRGTQEDLDEAVHWFRIAAENGDAEAQADLALCYSLALYEGC